MLNNELFDSCFLQTNSSNVNSNSQSNDLILTPNYQLQSKRAITGSNLKEKHIFFPNHASSFQPISINNQLSFNKNKINPLYTHSAISNSFCKYSRKVFIGGLPPDIDESIKLIHFQLFMMPLNSNSPSLDEIFLQFRHFGELVVDWPHKSDSKSTFPPKGYAFLIFEQESSVEELIRYCFVDRDKYYICISSSSVRDKPVSVNLAITWKSNIFNSNIKVQIRPWCLTDTVYLLDNNNPIDVRRTIFVGGVPRPLKSCKTSS
jgi:hypothetical protein